MSLLCHTGTLSYLCCHQNSPELFFAFFCFFESCCNFLLLPLLPLIEVFKRGKFWEKMLLLLHTECTILVEEFFKLWILQQSSFCCTSFERTREVSVNRESNLRKKSILNAEGFESTTPRTKVYCLDHLGSLTDPFNKKIKIKFEKSKHKSINLLLWN